MSRRGMATVVLSALVVGLFYLSAYPLHGHEQPLGFDTARYLWRNRCVAEGGFAALQDCRPPLATSMPGRVAEPLVVGAATSLIPASPLSSIAALPAVLAAVVALAAAALAGVRRRAGFVAIITIAVGTSGMVARLAGPEGYLDNLLALSLVTASLALTSRGGAPGGGAAIISLAAAGLAHWPTMALGVAVFGGAALLRGHASFRAWRSGTSLMATDAARLLVVASAGAALWGAAAALAVGSGPDRFFADPVSSREKVLADVAGYVLPVAIPLALVGAVVIGRERREDERLLEPVLASWIGVVGVAVVAWIASRSAPLPLPGSGFPLHRIVAMALPIPILAGIAVDGLRRAVSRRPIAALLVVAALTGWGWIGFRRWSAQVPFIDGSRLADASAASAYLEGGVPADMPVVFVVDGVAGNAFTDLYQIADNVRTQLSPQRVPHAYLYLGQIDQLRARRPTLIGDDSYDAASRFRWQPLPAILDGPHVVLVLRSLSPEHDDVARSMPQRVAAPGVVVLEGPAPPGRVAGIPTAPVSTLGVVGSLTALLGVLWIAGLGWARLVAGAGPGAVALAPALGAAALIWTGLLAGLAGIRASGWGGAAIVLVAGGAGAAAAIRWAPQPGDVPHDYSPEAGSAGREST